VIGYQALRLQACESMPVYVLVCHFRTCGLVSHMCLS